MATASPTIASFSPDSNVAGDRITNRNVLTLNGTGVANSTINVFDGTVLLGTATVNSSGAWTFATIALSDGAHSFTATDTAGGSTSAASAPLAVTVDTHAPNAPVIVSDVTDGARQEVLTGTAEANSTVKIYDGATLLGTTTANASGTWNFTTAAMTANGGGTGVTSDSLTATATDVAGNVSASSAASNVITVAGWWATADSHGANPTGPWWVDDNIWGVNTNTTSFTQVITLHSGTFPDNVTMTWSYPEIFAPSGKYAYPEIVYGATPYTLPAVSVPGGSTQLANLTNLTSTYNITLGGETGHYDVIWDVWFTSQPNGGAADRLFEVMIMPHSDVLNGTVWIPGGNFTKVFSGTDPAFGAYNVYTVDYGWTGVIVQPVGGVDKLSGTIDIGSIIKGMIWNGIVTGNEYVSGIEFGPEVDQGSGSMTVNALDYTWASKANTTGTAGNDAFTITTPGGNHIVGNGGTDTVIYFSVYAQNQLKISGSNLLVMQTGNYNTLDDLQGISFVKFADGTYNVSTHTFTQGVGTSGAPVILGITPDSGTAGDGITNAAALTLSGLAPANSTVKVYDGATLLGSVTANASGAWSFATGTLANGAHNFTATETASGTTSPASPVLSVTVDTVTPAKPAITGFSPDTGTVGDGVTTADALTLSGTAEANSTVKVYDGGALLGSATANASGVWSYTTPGLASTTHSFTATATDAAGNASAASTALSVTVNAPPNLIVNGSFETGDFSGWTMGANYGPNQWGPGTSIDANAHSGTFAANLGPVGSDGTMSEVVQTTAGAHYTLDFWLANSGGGPDDFAVKWNGQSVIALTNSPAQGYTEYTFDVVGTAGTSTLEFDFRQDPSHWSLDDITLKPAGGGGSSPPIAAPVITSYAADSGVIGDGITNDATLTLAGTAVANSTVKVFDGGTLLGTTSANASGAWSYTTGALSNATHSLTATATDVGGNVSAASTALAVTVDTVAPAKPAIVSFSPDTGTLGDGLTTANLLTLTGTAEANSTVKVFDGGTLLGTAIADASGAWSYNTTTLAVAAHVFTATATDAAGNASAASTALNVTVNANAVAAPSIASFSTDSGVAGDGITNDNTLTLSGTAVPLSTVTLFDGAAQIGSVTAGATGAWSYTTAALSNATHNFTATATLSGITSAASSALGVTVDTVAPSAPVISAFSTDTGVVGDGITGDNTLTLTGTAEANSTVKVFDGGALLGTAVAAANGTWSYDTATLSNATHTFTATATDAAGNASATSTALTVTVAASGNLLVNGDFESGNFSGWTLGGNSGAGPFGAQTFMVSNAQNGQFAAGLGSVGSDGVMSQSIQTVLGQHYTVSFWLADMPATWSGSGGVTVPNDFAAKWNGATLMSLTNAAAQGYTQYTYDVVGTGGAVTLEFDFREDPSEWNLDNISVTPVGAPPNSGPPTPPAPSIISFSTDTGTTGDGITSDTTLLLTGTAAANSTVTLFDGATQIGTATASATGAWSYTTATLTSAVHSFTATATVAGGTSAASTVLAVTVDTVVPSAPAIASFSNDTGVVGDGITNDNTLTLTGTAEANSTVKVFDGATLLGTATTNSSGAWSYTTGILSNAAHSFTATATDAAGNTSVVSSALTVTVDAVAPNAPVISAFSSDTGTAGDGITSDNALTLTGSAEVNSTVTVYDGAAQLGTATANGSGAWSFTTGTLSNAIHSFTAKATDVAGNTGAASTALSVTVDTAAPSAPAISAFSTDTGVVGDGITSDNALTLTGTAEANSTVAVFDGATQLGTATANGSGAWSYTTGVLSNAAHGFTAKATDAAGNTGAASSVLNVTVDTVAPTKPVIASFTTDTGVIGDGITTDNTLTLTGTAEANSTVKVFDGATQIGTTAANGSGAWSYTTGVLSTAAHGLTVTATDAAGNISTASAALNVTVIASPNTPSITSFSSDTGVAGDGITSDNVLVLTGTAVASSTVTIFDGATQLGTATANSSGAWTFTTATLSSAAHSFTATATVSGVTSPSSPPLNVTVDTVAPNAPTISSFSNDTGVVGDGITGDNTLTLTGTAEANSTVKVFDGATQLGTATANGSGAWSFTTATLSNATHSFTATATDAAGNTGSASAALAVTVNNVAPAAPTILAFANDTGVAGDGITNDNALTLSGTAVANSTVKVFDGATQIGTATANGGGAWSFATATLTNATHSFTATATDTVGNTSAASSAFAVTVDTVAPGKPAIATVSTDSGVAGDGITNDSTLTLTGTAEANSTVTVFDGGTQIGTAAANGSGAWSFTSGSLTNAIHSFTATATDAAGNTGAASTAVSVTVDTVAPSTPAISAFSTDSGVLGDGITNDSTPTLTGTAEVNSTVKVFDGATLLGTTTANGSGAWSFTTGALSNATHSFTASATDAAGNVSAASAALNVTVDTTAPSAPAISGFSNDTGVAGDGITNDTTLTLTGTAGANSTVKVFDGATQIGTANANASGDWSYITGILSNAIHSLTAIATDVAGNSSAASAALAVTVDTVAPIAPTISGFANDTGVAGDRITGDNTVTLTGTAEVNSTVKVFDGAALLGSATTNGAGAWSFTSGPLADATHQFTATDTDAAGNASGASAAFAVTVDTHAPTAPIIAADDIVNGNHVSLSGTAEANSTVNVFDGGTQIGTATASAGGSWSYTTGALAAGNHNFTATDMDAAGNTSSASTGVSDVITTPPIPVSITNFIVNSKGIALLGGASEANSTVSVYDGNTSAYLGSTTAAADGTWSLNMSGVSNTVHSYMATASNAAGNSGATPGSVVFGTVGNDAIAGGAGNDVLYGRGGNDTFVFSGNFGKDYVSDFQPNGSSMIQFDHGTFADFAAIQAHMTQVGADTVITLDTGNSVTLHNLLVAQLTSNDFHIL